MPKFRNTLMLTSLDLAIFRGRGGLFDDYSVFSDWTISVEQNGSFNLRIALILFAVLFSKLVFLGKPEATFEVHRIILAARCPYFRAAFANPTDDAMVSETKIVDSSKESVEMLLRFIYCAQLPEEIEVKM